MKLIEKLSNDLFVYQPGNCTRYMILARKIEPCHWDPDADLAIFWLKHGDRGGVGMVLPSSGGSQLHLSYFCEKTGIGEADAVALLCFLGEQFGVKVSGIPIAYRREAWFQQAEARGANCLVTA